MNTTLMIICGVLVIVVGVPFVLGWWRVADKWADAEHKRFQPKKPKPKVASDARTIKRPDSAHQD